MKLRMAQMPNFEAFVSSRAPLAAPGAVCLQDSAVVYKCQWRGRVGPPWIQGGLWLFGAPVLLGLGLLPPPRPAQWDRAFPPPARATSPRGMLATGGRCH